MAISIAFCYKFIGVHVCQKLPNRAWSGLTVIAKIKWCSFLTHSVVFHFLSQRSISIRPCKMKYCIEIKCTIGTYVAKTRCDASQAPAVLHSLPTNVSHLQ